MLLTGVVVWVLVGCTVGWLLFKAACWLEDLHYEMWTIRMEEPEQHVEWYSGTEVDDFLDAKH